MLIHINAFAQTPEKMSYQAVVRDNSGELIKNSNVDLKIIVREGSHKGTNVYEETHSIKSNKNGLVTAEIGTGSVIKGLFNEIEWSRGTYFIETQMDPEGRSNYTVSGTSQMLSVPYALHAKSADHFTGTLTPAQIKGLNFYSDADIDGNEMAFDNWDKNSTDDFSGDFNDLKNLPNFYTADQIDNLLINIDTDSGISQKLNLNGNNLAISGGNFVVFDNWDTNANDDFSGIYDDLKNKPELFSGQFKDLQNLPNIYTVEEVNNLIEGIESNAGAPQNLNLNQNTLSISGGNSISFENWDTNADDDFSGIYADLQNKPDLYDKSEIDNLIDGIETNGAVSQNLSLKQKTIIYFRW